MKYPTIEFKPFEFPSWEERNQSAPYMEKKIGSYVLFNGIGIGNRDKITFRLEFREIENVLFKAEYPNTKKDWEALCETMNKIKYELYCEAGK